MIRATYSEKDAKSKGGGQGLCSNAVDNDNPQVPQCFVAWVIIIMINSIPTQALATPF